MIAMILIVCGFVALLVILIALLAQETVPQLNARCVKTHEFIKALTEKETPQIHFTLSLGYIHSFTLVFKEVKVDIDYNDIRDEWSLEIWSYEAEQFLFWHTCIDTQPVDAMNVLIKKYGLGERVEKSIARKEHEESKKKKIINDVVKRTLS